MLHERHKILCLYMGVLISEDFLEGQTADWSNLLQSLDIKFLLVTQDQVAVGLAGHRVLLEVHDVVELEVGQGIEDYRVDVVVQPQSFSCHVTA